MRTYGRIYGDQTPPVQTTGLPYASWAFDCITVTSGQPDPMGGMSGYLMTPNNCTAPVAFGPGIAIPQALSASYVMQTSPNGNAWVSYVVDYIDNAGTALFSDILSYNYVTGVYDQSQAPNGAVLSVIETSARWFTATIYLPGTFRGGVVGTQLEYWPVGISPTYVDLSASAVALEADYVVTPFNWIEIDTDANGFNDNVYLTTLAQVLALNLGESPFFANYGIPQQQTVVTQVYPDFYAAQTQTQFAPYFASLIIKRAQGSSPPVYTVTAISHSGALLTEEIAQ